MLKIDRNAAFESSGTTGVTSDEMASLGSRVSGCLAGLAAGGPMRGWVTLPDATATARSASRYASALPGSIRHVVILGIGGSSLGPLALYSAMRHPFLDASAGRTLRFLDNVDPDTVSATLDALDPAQTLHVVITKSGSTAETASQFLVSWEKAKRDLGDRCREHFVFVTDPVRGDLRALATRLGVEAFDVPVDVGGRFSVLSAVGLLPAALAGIDPARILEGARRIRPACLESPPERNPAALLASVAYLMDRDHGRHVHTIMTYSDRLAPVGAWFRQLWAESLGKLRDDSSRVGPTPLDARGATDQHSLLQLLVQGPHDKLVLFLDVASREDVPIPALFGELSSFGYLGGSTLASLLSAERRGTEMSLARAGTPSITLTVDEVSPECLGALFYLLEVTTAIAGELYGIDPYDQPGVEEGKKLAYGLLGREGYEDRRTSVERFDATRRRELILEI
jgi:glucose-6-phosphate isomerase